MAEPVTSTYASELRLAKRVERRADQKPIGEGSEIFWAHGDQDLALTVLMRCVTRSTSTDGVWNFL